MMMMESNNSKCLDSLRELGSTRGSRQQCSVSVALSGTPLLSQLVLFLLKCLLPPRAQSLPSSSSVVYQENTSHSGVTHHPLSASLWIDSHTNHTLSTH